MDEQLILKVADLIRVRDEQNKMIAVLYQALEKNGLATGWPDIKLLDDEQTGTGDQSNSPKSLPEDNAGSGRKQAKAPVRRGSDSSVKPTA